jgi:hypothetical protein
MHEAQASNIEQHRAGIKGAAFGVPGLLFNIFVSF